MKESTSAHSTKHQERVTEIDAGRVTIEFGAEVTRSLVRLEKAIRSNPEFNTDVLLLLHSLSSGEPISIEGGLTNLLMVTREAAKYAERTGDCEIGSALTEVIGHVMGQSRDAKPITLRVEPKTKRR